MNLVKLTVGIAVVTLATGAIKARGGSISRTGSKESLNHSASASSLPAASAPVQPQKTASRVSTPVVQELQGSEQAVVQHEQAVQAQAGVASRSASRQSQHEQAASQVVQAQAVVAPSSLTSNVVLLRSASASSLPAASAPVQPQKTASRVSTPVVQEQQRSQQVVVQQQEQPASQVVQAPAAAAPLSSTESVASFRSPLAPSLATASAPAQLQKTASRVSTPVVQAQQGSQQAVVQQPEQTVSPASNLSAAAPAPAQPQQPTSPVVQAAPAASASVQSQQALDLSAAGRSASRQSQHEQAASRVSTPVVQEQQRSQQVVVQQQEQAASLLIQAPADAAARATRSGFSSSSQNRTTDTAAIQGLASSSQGALAGHYSTGSGVTVNSNEFINVPQQIQQPASRSAKITVNNNTRNYILLAIAGLAFWKRVEIINWLRANGWLAPEKTTDMEAADLVSAQVTAATEKAAKLAPAVALKKA